MEQTSVEINTLLADFAIVFVDDDGIDADEQVPTSTTPTANILGLLSASVLALQ